MTRKILILYLAHFCLGCVGYFIKNTFKIHSSVDLNTMTRLKCIGTELTPIVQDKSGEQFDNDNSWKTKADQLVVPVHKENFTVRPELITFDATYTLIEPSQSIGRWYREALNIACDMQIRLPRPALFTAAFKKAYAYM